MAVKIRLARLGAKKKPMYRIVAADSQAPRDGSFLEIVGTYDPHQNPALVQVDAQALAKWLGRGAQPSDAVGSLLKSRGLLPAVEPPAAQ
jgi:small subunit ribosomal protein S16